MWRGAEDINYGIAYILTLEVRNTGVELYLPYIYSKYDARSADTAMHIIYTNCPKFLYYKTIFL
jgi:hypothetical protein